MEQDTKTVTMPYSEYEQMKNEIANMKLIKGFDNSEKIKYEKEIEEIKKNNRELLFLVYKRLDLKDEVEELKKINKKLEEEIDRLQKRKWYQFWKC